MSEKSFSSFGDLETLFTEIGNKIKAKAEQVSSMPVATSSIEGKMVQFVGTTNDTYTHGYFYECEENSGTYSWVNVPVGEGSGDVSDSTTTITTSTATYPEYSAGETLKIIFGKIKKFLSDLKGNKTDLTNLATVEPTTTASKAYSAGDWLILNGQLYEVTAPIPSGGTITVGTNVEPTTVEDGKSSGGGHTILDSSGTAMTQRTNVQFTSKVSDDSGNDKTVVYSGSEENITIGHTTGSSGTGKWITENNTIDGTVYPYRYSATLTKPIYGMPKIEYVATKGSGSSSAKATAFNCIAYVGHDVDYPTTLKLYATAVPTVDFNILVKWEGGEV